MLISKSVYFRVFWIFRLGMGFSFFISKEIEHIKLLCTSFPTRVNKKQPVENRECENE